MLGLDDIFTFGKYKDRTIKEVIDTDWNYVKWAIIDSQRLIADIDAIVEYHKGKIRILQPDDIISFGKYKGKTLHSVFLTDFQYLKWMESQNPDFKVDWDKLSDFHKSKISKNYENKSRDIVIDQIFYEKMKTLPIGTEISVSELMLLKLQESLLKQMGF